MNKEIQDSIRNGYTIITPTVRLGRFLQTQFARSQVAAGQTVWESPEIVSWQTWLNSTWARYHSGWGENFIHLSNPQQYSVWLQIIKQSDSMQNLLQPSTVTQNAIRAWTLYHQWNIPLYPEDVYISQDVRAFQSWANAYQKRCDEEQWIDDSLICDDLCAHLDSITDIKTGKFAFTGFDLFLPQQEKFLQSLRAVAGELKIVPVSSRNKKINWGSFENQEGEIKAVATWARMRLEQNPKESVGIVVPNLHDCRELLEDTFYDVLLPSAIISHDNEEAVPFSISLGKNLAAYPLIESAFGILSLCNQPLDIVELSNLLHSPFVGNAMEELAHRALLDEKLRSFGEQRVSMKGLVHILNTESEEDQNVSQFLTGLQNWHSHYDSLPERQTAREWAEAFSALLKIFGWPGERNLNSDEFQTLQAWQELLQRFTALDVVQSPMKYQNALGSLRQLANQFSFQPETQEVPIQILGIDGAAGMEFDHLWLLGMTEDTWPQAQESLPFIPASSQKQYALPMARAEHRLRHAKTMTAALLGSAEDVVLSFPLTEGEHSLRASALIKPYLDEERRLDIKAHPGYESLIHASRRYEEFTDQKAPGLPPDSLVSGGTALFRDHSACAFRAFARHRLYARSLARVDIGLNAMERGLLIHEVLQKIWMTITSQETLLKYDETELGDLIKKNVNYVFKGQEKARPETYAAQFSEIEKERIFFLVAEWLELEKKRQSFVVKSCEKKQLINYAGLKISARIDRVDELSDGREVIIDYKTGKASISAWFNERPDEPQLPLYALSTARAPAAVLFARITPGETGFVGLTETEEIAPGVKSLAESKFSAEFENWQAVLNLWNTHLTRIANEIKDGLAKVDPRDAQTCRYCDLHALCRIHEQTHDSVGADLES